jgi:CheY-like chemotaxis protein
MYRADELMGTRVLVVDDNASAREILSTMALSFGLEVDARTDGPEALRMVGRPTQATGLRRGADGLEDARDGRPGDDAALEAGHYRSTPTVIMVTAYGREEALDGRRAPGVAATVLTKPVTPPPCSRRWPKRWARACDRDPRHGEGRIACASGRTAGTAPACCWSRTTT